MGLFQKAKKSQKKLRMALCGPSGSGKTYSALSLASCLGERIAVIDTERSSSSLYSDRFEFDSCPLTNHHPSKYVETIREASAEGYDVLIIDSLSHAWYSELDLVGGRFDNWAKVRPLERALIDAILDFPGHVIVTMRSKTEYVVTQKTNASGKVSNAPEKIGTAPIQSSGIEYEFDVTGDLSLDHILTIGKTRCQVLDQTTWLNPGKELSDVLQTWLTDGLPMPVLPETDEQKKTRFANACKSYEITAAQTKPLLAKYHAKRAADLTSEQLDEVIKLLPTLVQGEEETQF